MKRVAQWWPLTHKQAARKKGLVKKVLFSRKRLLLALGKIAHRHAKMSHPLDKVFYRYGNIAV